jgi:hypothetical protein
MAYSSLQQLLAAVNSFVTGSGDAATFRMPANGLDSTAVEKLLTDYLIDQGTTDWVLTTPTTPSILDQAVVLSGSMPLLLGMVSAVVDVSFTLDDTQNAQLVVRLAPLDPRQPYPITDWNLGNAFPVWAETRSPLTNLAFKAPTFYFASIDFAANGSRQTLVAGLSFTADELELTGILQPLAYLPNVAFKALNGPITHDIPAPYMTLASAPVTPIPISYLNLPFTFEAVSTDPANVTGLKIQTPAPPVVTYLAIRSEVAPGSGIPVVPLVARFNGVGNFVQLAAELEGISTYAITQLGDFVHQFPLGSYLDSVFQIGEYVALRELSTTIQLNPFSLAAVTLTLGTTRSITVIDKYVVVDNVSATFGINDPGGTATAVARLRGDFTFLDQVPVSISALYPEMLFSGGLNSENPIPLATLVQKYVPSVTSFPDISLNRLFMQADFTNKRYSFQLAVTSRWQIPIGIALFELEDASLDLGIDTNNNTQFSGEISAIAVFFSNTGLEIGRFFASWTLPGTFQLQGGFPEIQLTDLASTLTGGWLQNADGLPNIVLTDSQVFLRLATGSTTSYKFALATTINVDKIGAAELFFEVRKGTSATFAAPAPRARLTTGRTRQTTTADNATGFVVGMVLAPNWKPDSIWSGLGDVFKYLEVKSAGMILSTIEDTSFSLADLKLDYVPTTIQPGITFFSTLALKGELFGNLKWLFSDNIEFELGAWIDTKNLVNSEIYARLPADDGKGAISFTGLEVALKPGKLEFDIKAGAIFRIQSENLTLKGSGRISAKPPSAALAIAVTNWAEPFGIKGLNILAFGLSVELDEVGVSIGLLGSFQIGTGTTAFKFLIGGKVTDFEAPTALAFALDSVSGNPLKLTDMIEQFTSLDLSKVPLLNGLAFKTLDFYVVVDPSGWLAPDGHHYPFGIGVDADVFFYDWELKVFIQVDYNKGVIAEGSISKPIELLDVLKISDTTGELGPWAKIDTTAILTPAVPVMERIGTQIDRTRLAAERGGVPAVVGINPYTIRTAGDAEKAYFAMSGAVNLLGLSQSFSGSVTSNGFEVNFSASLADLFEASFMAQFSKSEGFQGHAEGRFDFSLDLPNGFSIGGWQVLPPLTVKGPYAFLSIDCAVKPSEAWLDLYLEFEWGKIKINPSISIDATAIKNALANLWQELKNWILNDLSAFFEHLLADVWKYIEMLKDGFIWFGQSVLEIGRVLYHVFSIQNITEFAQMLIETGRYAFDAMAGAIVEIFNVAFSEAVKVLESLGEICTMATNELFLNDASATTRNQA